MSTLPDKNELEFAKIEEIANSENDHPVFMLNLNMLLIKLRKLVMKKEKM